ncbi:MAG: FAD-dependent oxidoreductase [Deltaproteobacteria bacterium]|jgi:thioredoxin reductase (NADPH)|nr:FAD-dependent oxidoreductase [Deltaproteobacteria bacterium]
MKNYDAAVIGAGPAGLTAALYLARFGLRPALLEKLTPGGMLLQTFAIENYPGLGGVKGYALADAMEAQLAPYAIDRYAGEVTAMEHAPGKNRLRIDEEWIESRSVVICSGLKYRKLDLPLEDKFVGRGLSYCALCDGQFYKNKVVGVVGGGNAALEESVYLSSIVKELHLFHRRDEFRGAKIYVDKITGIPNIKIHYSSVLAALHGEDGLEGVTVRDLAGNRSEYMPLSGLFIFAGFQPTGAFFPDELKRDEDGFIITDTEMRTNLPGIFAAGDIRAKLCRQVATAVGDGATAANSVYAFVEHGHV